MSNKVKLCEQEKESTMNETQETELQKDSRDRKEKLDRALAVEQEEYTVKNSAGDEVLLKRVATKDNSKGNEAYFEKQRQLEAQIAEQNASNAAAQKERERTANERRIAENKALIEGLHGTTNKPPTGFLDPYGLVPAPRTPSVSLTPKPARFPSSDPRNGLSPEQIIDMGLEPDPEKSPFKTQK
jgi:hypothetical protein